MILVVNEQNIKIQNWKTNFLSIWKKCFSFQDILTKNNMGLSILICIIVITIKDLYFCFLNT